MSVGAALCFVVYTVVTLSLYITMGSLVIVLEKTVNNGEGISSFMLNQVAKQWVEKPIVGAVVQPRQLGNNFGMKCPDDYPEYIVERMFHGADVTCDCLGIYDPDIDTSDFMEVGSTCDYNQTRAGCRPGFPIMPFAMHSFNGNLYCGRRGGDPFLNATRPDFQTKHCPSGTLPCSNSTSLENTFCYNAS